MLPELSTYSLAPPAFPLPALAALAGRFEGSERDVALACFMAAHLATGLLPLPEADALEIVASPRGAIRPVDRGPVPIRLARGVRAERAAGARGWYAALSVPAAVRVACVRLADATAGADPADAATALQAVAVAAGEALDEAANAELRRVADALRAARAGA